MKNTRFNGNCLRLILTAGLACAAFASAEPACCQTLPATGTNPPTAVATNAVPRTRVLDETEIRMLLTETLQHDFVKDRGELELRFTRPWTSVEVPNEPLEVVVSDLPTMGVTPNFIVRVQVRVGKDTVGPWQLPVQARVWRDVWVAHSTAKRGDLVSEVELTRERRDVLTLRDPLLTLDRDDSSLEIAEYLPAGTPLTSRSVRQRAVIHRGKLADAVVQDGALMLSVKVEALEDGVPGQNIRVRNVKSKREFRGKVQNEETILVTL
jgi:flagella basal body P-ring formation protein FlgA